MAKQIPEDALHVLERCTTDGNKLFLPTGQLDRKLYDSVNKVLEALGGKWNRGARAHIFADGAEGVLDDAIMTGEYTRTKQDFGQFFTPPELATVVIGMAGIAPGMRVLEPNAGGGALVYAALEAGAKPVDAYEIDPHLRAALKHRLMHRGDFTVDLRDFLQVEPAPVYDRVVMNPPFAKQADIDHVLHAVKFLKPSGRLVAIMSASVLFRDNKKTRDFRDHVDASGGMMEALPDGSFTASGTNVRTCIVTYEN